MPFTSSGIYWKREGIENAPALVLLNSIGTDMDLWSSTLPFLRERFTLLRIDTRGHGASEAGSGDLALEMLADDVLATADAAGLARFSLAGVSLGGMIAMELALHAAARVEKLILVCTSATMDSTAWDERVRKVRGEGMLAIADLAMGRFLSDAASPATYQSVKRQLLSMDPEGYAGSAAAIRDMDIAGRIRGIEAPALVVTGTRDDATPFESHGRYLLTNIPRAAHVSLEAAHLAPLEAPETLASAIIHFLGS